MENNKEDEKDNGKHSENKKEHENQPNKKVDKKRVINKSSRRKNSQIRRHEGNRKSVRTQNDSGKSKVTVKIDKEENKTDKKEDKTHEEEDKNYKKDDKTAKQEDKTDEKEDIADKEVDKTDKEVEKTDKEVDKTDKRIDKTDKGVDKTDKGVDKTDKGVDKTDKKSDKFSCICEDDNMFDESENEIARIYRRKQIVDASRTQRNILKVDKSKTKAFVTPLVGRLSRKPSKDIIDEKHPSDIKKSCQRTIIIDGKEQSKNWSDPTVEQDAQTNRDNLEKSQIKTTQEDFHPKGAIRLKKTLDQPSTRIIQIPCNVSKKKRKVRFNVTKLKQNANTQLASGKNIECKISDDDTGTDHLDNSEAIMKKKKQIDSEDMPIEKEICTKVTKEQLQGALMSRKVEGIQYKLIEGIQESSSTDGSERCFTRQDKAPENVSSKIIKKVMLRTDSLQVKKDREKLLLLETGRQKGILKLPDKILRATKKTVRFKDDLIETGRLQLIEKDEDNFNLINVKEGVKDFSKIMDQEITPLTKVCKSSPRAKQIDEEENKRKDIFLRSRKEEEKKFSRNILEKLCEKREKGNNNRQHKQDSKIINDKEKQITEKIATTKNINIDLEKKQKCEVELKPSVKKYKHYENYQKRSIPQALPKILSKKPAEDIELESVKHVENQMEFIKEQNKEEKEIKRQEEIEKQRKLENVCDLEIQNKKRKEEEKQKDFQEEKQKLLEQKENERHKELKKLTKEKCQRKLEEHKGKEKQAKLEKIKEEEKQRELETQKEMKHLNQLEKQKEEEKQRELERKKEEKYQRQLETPKVKEKHRKLKKKKEEERQRELKTQKGERYQRQLETHKEEEKLRELEKQEKDEKQRELEKQKEEDNQKEEKHQRQLKIEKEDETRRELEKQKEEEKQRELEKQKEDDNQNELLWKKDVGKKLVCKEKDKSLEEEIPETVPVTCGPPRSTSVEVKQQELQKKSLRQKIFDLLGIPRLIASLVHKEALNIRKNYDDKEKDGMKDKLQLKKETFVDDYQGSRRICKDEDGRLNLVEDESLDKRESNDEKYILDKNECLEQISLEESTEEEDVEESSNENEICRTIRYKKLRFQEESFDTESSDEGYVYEQISCTDEEDIKRSDRDTSDEDDKECSPLRKERLKKLDDDKISTQDINDFLCGRRVKSKDRFKNIKNFAQDIDISSLNLERKKQDIKTVSTGTQIMDITGRNMILKGIKLKQLVENEITYDQSLQEPQIASETNLKRGGQKFTKKQIISEIEYKSFKRLLKKINKRKNKASQTKHNILYPKLILFETRSDWNKKRPEAEEDKAKIKSCKSLKTRRDYWKNKFIQCLLCAFKTIEKFILPGQKKSELCHFMFTSFSRAVLNMWALCVFINEIIQIFYLGLYWLRGLKSWVCFTGVWYFNETLLIKMYGHKKKDQIDWNEETMKNSGKHRDGILLKLLEKNCLLEIKPSKKRTSRGFKYFIKVMSYLMKPSIAAAHTTLFVLYVTHTIIYIQTPDFKNNLKNGIHL